MWHHHKSPQAISGLVTHGHASLGYSPHYHPKSNKHPQLLLSQHAHTVNLHERRREREVKRKEGREREKRKKKGNEEERKEDSLKEIRV